MRLSELREYSTRDVSSAARPREVAIDYVPNAAAAQALTRRSYTNGLALTETEPRRERLSALGELVQIVY